MAVAIALLIGAALLMVASNLSKNPITQPSDVARFDEPAGRQLKHAEGAVVARQQSIPVGLARAYAAIGEQADGKNTRLSSLDDDSSRYLEQARALFAAQTLQRSLEQSSKPTDVSEPDSPVPSLEGAHPTDSPVTVTQTGESVATPAPSKIALGPVDERALPKQFTVGDKKALPPQIVGDLDKELIAPDAWVAIPYKPGFAQGKPLTIRNRSGAGYAISLHGTDFGTVRVNGGLVVPGRFYQIHQIIEITSDVPVNIHVRPLGVVTEYHDVPVIPRANG